MKLGKYQVIEWRESNPSPLDEKSTYWYKAFCLDKSDYAPAITVGQNPVTIIFPNIELLRDVKQVYYTLYKDKPSDSVQETKDRIDLVINKLANMVVFL